VTLGHWSASTPPRPRPMPGIGTPSSELRFAGHSACYSGPVHAAFPQRFGSNVYRFHIRNVVFGFYLPPSHSVAGFLKRTDGYCAFETSASPRYVRDTRYVLFVSSTALNGRHAASIADARSHPRSSTAVACMMAVSFGGSNKVAVGSLLHINQSNVFVTQTRPLASTGNIGLKAGEWDRARVRHIPLLG